MQSMSLFFSLISSDKDAGSGSVFGLISGVLIQSVEIKKLAENNEHLFIQESGVG